MKITCISFILAAQLNQNTPPNHVQEIVQSRIKVQFENSNPDLDLKWNDHSCVYQGSYFYSEDAVELRADHAYWVGQAQYDLSILLDGRKISFKKYIPARFEEAIYSAPNPVVKTSISRKYAKWVNISSWLILSGVGVWFATNQNKKKPSLDSAVTF